MVVRELHNYLLNNSECLERQGNTTTQQKGKATQQTLPKSENWLGFEPTLLKLKVVLILQWLSLLQVEYRLTVC